MNNDNQILLTSLVSSLRPLSFRNGVVRYRHLSLHPWSPTVVSDLNQIEMSTPFLVNKKCEPALPTRSSLRTLPLLLSFSHLNTLAVFGEK